MNRTTVYFPNILPDSYDYDAVDKGYRHKKIAARELPFTDDKLIELFDSGVDFEKLADAYENNAFNKAVALAAGQEWAAANPVEPLRPGLQQLAIADKLQARIGHCPEYWLPGIGTGDGLGYSKELVCGKEWCPECGQLHSIAHQRRMFSQHKRKDKTTGTDKVGLSWYDKLTQLKTAGYWVIEKNLAKRGQWHSKTALENDGKIVASVFSGEYEIKQRRAAGDIVRRGEIAKIRGRWFDKGLRRWHFFGDVAKNIQQVIDSQDGIKQLPLSDDFSPVTPNPHLNTITESGYIPDAKFEHIKSMLKQALGDDDLIIHYSFTSEPGRIVHLLSYVTRATFLDIRWDKFLAGSLYGFRNMRSWGKWDAAPVWSLDDLDSSAKEIIAGVDIDSVRRIGKGLDSVGKPIQWANRPDKIVTLRIIQKSPLSEFVDYGAGFGSFKLPVGLDYVRVDETPQMYWQRLLNTVMAESRSQDRLKDSGVSEVNEMYHRCVVCSNKLSKLTSYLVVNGVLMPYCGQDKCQEHMKETKAQFGEYGISSRMVKDG